MVTTEAIRKVFLSLLPDLPDRGYVQQETSAFGPDEWRNLFALAQKTGLLPCFYMNINRLSLPNVPSDLLSEFKTLFIFNLKKNSQLEGELLEILSTLKQNNIIAIALKGPVLSRCIHGDLSFRQASCDVDILVRPQDRERAEAVLKEVGYNFMPSNLKPEFFHKFRTSIMLQRETPQGELINLDLHWGFRDKFFPAHIKEFWSCAGECEYLHSRVTLPSAEDLLIFLSLTAVSDFDFIQPKYLYDIHKLLHLDAQRLEWERIHKQAKRYGLIAAVFFSLSLAREIFKTDVSRQLLYRFRPAFPKYLFCKLWLNSRNILSYRERIAATYSWRYFISSYLLTGGVIYALRRIYKKIFISIEEVGAQHGTVSAWRLFFLYIRRFLKPLYLPF